MRKGMFRNIIILAFMINGCAIRENRYKMLPEATETDITRFYEYKTECDTKAEKAVLGNKSLCLSGPLFLIYLPVVPFIEGSKDGHRKKIYNDCMEEKMSNNPVPYSLITK